MLQLNFDMEESRALYTPQDLINNNRTPNWTKDFPVTGQGTLVFSIQRSTPFFIVIRPKLEPGEPGADQWISLTVEKDEACFSVCMDNKVKELIKVTDTDKNELVGYEEHRKISYWVSYNRDLLTIKYGKGYRMIETTLMTFDFLKDAEDPKAVREKMKYLFSPEIRRKIEQYDIDLLNVMIQQYANRIKILGYRRTSLEKLYPNLLGEALDKKAQELSKSMIDIEREVAFDKNPLVCNWSPFVLDSSQVTLFDLDSTNYTFSASLPRYCLEMYTNVTAPEVDLDWSPIHDKYRLSDAIRFSLKGPNGILHKKLASKAGDFGYYEQTYINVTLGKNRGSSPSVPYVLKIWPVDHGTPIHNHGNSYAIIKVLHGGLTIKIFNKDAEDDANSLQTFDLKKNDVTWISPNWFQTHQLWNATDDYCATIQCYQYGKNDFTEWPYFDYVADTSMIDDEFLPDSDYTFLEMRDIVMNEFQEFMDTSVIYSSQIQLDDF